MALVSNMVLLLLLVCLCQQLAPVSSHGNQKSDRRADKDAHKASSRLFRGRDKRGCSWAASGEDRDVTLVVTCLERGSAFVCQYAATPCSCARYAADSKLYWKQMGRALRRHGSLCREGSAPVRAALCRGAPPQAHFRLKTTETPTATSVKSCIPENRKLAREYCKEAWSDLCTFLFTMVQGDAC
ncbi:fibroblast growth factor-binding protein 1 [Phyllopteryx taeniolatus]|uniref:fibroblast growth factor-binding protein 1 n=1 Tax=Phyllopteryx taeniolatus TaxID=161469 RepID=UPI002AD47B78|nr:fibroblast growth factor-binding protein 1 [Phyllopteryx taeniolatus]